MDVARVGRLATRRADSVRVEVRVVGVHRDHRQARPLPEVLVLDLGHRHVEPVAHPRLQAAQRLPLVLQRPRPGKVQVERQEADDHDVSTIERSGTRHKDHGEAIATVPLCL